jgi:hypothetical protein
MALPSASVSLLQKAARSRVVAGVVKNDTEFADKGAQVRGV